ncbi:hypothetical protein SAMN05192560_0933 [Methylobacillus rhizosphaerae]|uniref:Uncharacterized protein n=1 Tax=Methylobacillus rhizosphaerae TaxID=551994 RepID=A0A238YZF8_9PROT|nr:hypothetical protein [Methylobacillus rhizosphaerae]SNR76023.1 hypothetical protein SAMN05192560_0933 [Methylobacillus rhizosphaerae]
MSLSRLIICLKQWLLHESWLVVLPALFFLLLAIELSLLISGFYWM